MDTNQPIVYLDTSIVSRLETEQLSTLKQLFFDRKAAPVISHHVIDEIKRGQPSNEKSILREIGAGFIDLYQEPDDAGTVKAEFPIPDIHFQEDASAEPLLSFLDYLFRALSGGTNDKPVSEIFRDGIEAFVNQIFQDLDGISDEKLKLHISIQLDRLRSVFASIDFGDTPDFRIDGNDLRSLQAGPDYLSEIGPPKVIERVIQRVSVDAQGYLNREFRPIDDPKEFRDRLVSAAGTLLTLGFAGSPDVRSSDQSSGLRASRAQLRDIGHISAASGCAAYVTKDKRAARLSFALFERFNVFTEVIYLNQSIDGYPFKIVGKDFWP